MAKIRRTKYFETRIVGNILERKCTECHKFKKLSEFYLDVKCSFGTLSKCKECLIKKQQLNKLKNFGLTANIDEYYKLREKGCAICGEETLELKIDHEHRTGRFRGMLCHNCNAGLGHFRDSPTLLLKAASYIEEFYRKINEKQETVK